MQIIKKACAPFPLVNYHHFSDASEIGYGTASYIRQVIKNGDINVALTDGKVASFSNACDNGTTLRINGSRGSSEGIKFKNKKLNVTPMLNVYWTYNIYWEI